MLLLGRRFWSIRLGPNCLNLATLLFSTLKFCLNCFQQPPLAYSLTLTQNKAFIWQGIGPLYLRVFPHEGRRNGLFLGGFMSKGPFAPSKESLLGGGQNQPLTRMILHDSIAL